MLAEQALQAFQPRQQQAQPLLVGPAHRPADLVREAVAMQVHPVNVSAAAGHRCLENLRPFIDQRQQAALADFLVVDRAPMHAQVLGDFEHQRIDLGVVHGFTAAGGIRVVTLAAFLAETPQRAQGIVDLQQRRIHVFTGQLARTPLQVDADHVVHTKRAHGHAERLQRLIHLPRRGAFEQQLARLGHVAGEHAVADEARAVAGHHHFLAHTLPKGLGRLEHRRRSALPAHHFQQLHHMGRAEKMQPQHLFGPTGHGSDGVDIQCRSVAGQDGVGLERAVQGAEDLLLERQVLVHRFDHQVGFGEVVIGRYLAHPRQASVGLGLIDTALGHLLYPSLRDHRQAGFGGAGVVVQPQHRKACTGQADNDAAAHGAGADHRRLLNVVGSTHG